MSKNQAHEYNSLSQDKSRLEATKNQITRNETSLSNVQKEQEKLQQELKNQLNIFNEIAYLYGTYRETKGIILNPIIAATNVIPPEELVSSEVIKEAIKQNFTNGFDLSINKITNLDYQDNEGKTLLMHALINGFHYGVDQLLKKGASVNIIDTKGANALIYSAFLPHIKYVKQIIEKTDDVNHKAAGLGNNSALHFLIDNTHKTIFASELNHELKNCLSQHATIIVDEEYTLTSNFAGQFKFREGMTLNIVGNSPIILGHKKELDTSKTDSDEKLLNIIKFLVTKNIDFNLLNDRGENALILACKNKLKAVAQELIDKYKIDLAITDKNGFGILHWILEFRDKEFMEKIIKTGKVNINHQDNAGQTNLFWATAYSSSDIVDMLFNKYEALDLPNKQGFKAFDLAALTSNYSLIDIMQKKYNINSDHVKLWCAARNGDLAILEQQINKGIDINAVVGVKTMVANFRSTTPLIQAIIQGQDKVVERLIKAGVDINKPDNGSDNSSTTPLYYALGAAGQEIFPQIIKTLVNNNVNIKQDSINGNKPIHIAAYTANIGALKLLINKSASVNVMNLTGKKPLNVLIEQSDIDSQRKELAIKFLLFNENTITAQEINIYKTQGLITEKLMPYFQNPEALANDQVFQTEVAGLTAEYL